MSLSTTPTQKKAKGYAAKWTGTALAIPISMNTAIVWERLKSTATVRHNGKCKRCGAHHTRLIVRTTERTFRSDNCGEVARRIDERNEDGSRWAGVECCGSHVLMRAVKGTRNAEIVCGAKCTGSKGHVCECSCGGKNHGASVSL